MDADNRNSNRRFQDLTAETLDDKTQKVKVKKFLRNKATTYTAEMIKGRREWLAELTQTQLKHLAHFSEDAEDFKVIQCEDAETASLALKASHPSLLITDIKLTGKMSGIELAHLARMIDPTLRVVVISGQPPASPLPDGVTFFSKPVYPVALIREATH